MGMEMGGWLPQDTSLELPGVGQAFQPAFSKNTTLICIKLYTCSNCLFGLYGLYIFQLLLATQMLLIHHYTSLLYTFCSESICPSVLCMCMKSKFISQQFTYPKYINITSPTLILKNVTKKGKWQNKLQSSQRRLIINQETHSVSRYQIKHLAQCLT